MEIFYCDTCGKRASAEDKQNSLALSAERIFCKECLPKQAPTKTEPVLKASSSSAIVTERRPKTDSTARTQSRSKEETAPPAKNYLPLYLIGGMLVTFALVLIILSSQGSKKPTTTNTTTHSNPTDPPAKTTPVVQPKSVPSSSSSSSGTVAPTIPVVAPTESKSRELTPKEIYEQKLREGKIEPVKSPVLPPSQGSKVDLLAIATPPPNDPAWKKLFNGKDMSDWEMPKGTWDVTDGKMRCTSDPERGGSIISKLEFDDYEIIIKFKCSYQAEWYLRSDASFYLDLRDNPDWRIFRAVVKGRDLQASLDGKVMTPKVSGLAKSTINGFVHQMTKEYLVEEIRLRDLKPDEGAPEAPAPAPAPAPIPALTGEAKDLFNGKDLDGWNELKGSWMVEDGALTNGPDVASRVETTASYSNFELTFQIKIETGHHAEVQVLSYKYYAELSRAIAPDFKECKVTVRGAAVTILLDGKPVQIQSDSNDNSVTSGRIGFYVPKAMKCRIKDLRLKPLK